MRDVLLGDRNEDRRAWLGGQQVVTVGLQFFGLGVEAHRHQQTLLIQQERKVHCVGQGACLFAYLPQILDQTEGILPRFREHESKTLPERSIPVSNGLKRVIKARLQFRNQGGQLPRKHLVDGARTVHQLFS